MHKMKCMLKVAGSERRLEAAIGSKAKPCWGLKGQSPRNLLDSDNFEYTPNIIKEIEENAYIQQNEIYWMKHTRGYNQL